jgi:hypothetical protein
MFISNNTCKLINNDGFEKYIKISCKNGLPKLKIVGYGVIPMIDVEMYNRSTSNANFYEEYRFDDKYSIKEHLKRSI